MQDGFSSPPGLSTPLLSGQKETALLLSVERPSSGSTVGSTEPGSPALRSELSSGSTASTEDLEEALLAPLALPAPVARSHEDQRARWRFAGSCAVYTTLWWTAAVTVIMTIKSTVQPGVFPHSLAFTTLTQPTTGLLAWLLAQLVYRGKPAPPALQLREKAQILALGLIQGFEIGLTNKALEYLTVASRTTLNSMTVLFMMLVAWVWGLERCDWRRALSCAVLVCGGLLQGLQGKLIPQGAQAAYALGATMQLASMLLSAHRWGLAQFVMQRSAPDSGLGQLPKLQLLSRTLPVTGLVCLPSAYIFEPGAFGSEQLWQPGLWGRVLLVSVGLICMQYSELKLVKKLSAVAFQVLSTIHQIPIVLVGVVFQHNQFSELSACGFAACLLGALIYAWARCAEAKDVEASAASLRKRRSGRFSFSCRY